MARVSFIDIDSFIAELYGDEEIAKKKKEINAEECMKYAKILADMLSKAGGSYFAAQPSIASHFSTISIEQTSKGCDLYLAGGNDMALSRPSLNPNNSGAYNIVSLFIHGWDGTDNLSMKKLHGMWRGEMVGARLYREGTSFVEDTIDDFNSMYGEFAFVEVNSEYI